MNICIPVEADHGLSSAVCPHFGSAPVFMIVDTENGSCRAIANYNQYHGHGLCRPLQSLQGERIDAVLVSGIGRGALSQLSGAGIRVYVCEQSTVAEALAAFQAGTLQVMQPGMACGRHGHGHFCSGVSGHSR